MAGTRMRRVCPTGDDSGVHPVTNSGDPETTAAFSFLGPMVFTAVHGPVVLKFLAVLSLFLVSSAIGSGDPCDCEDHGPTKSGNCSIKIHECGCLHDVTEWRYEADGTRFLLT